MVNASPYFEGDRDGGVRCLLCPHLCSIQEGKRGKCLTRTNRNGSLEVTTHGRLSAVAVDPIEKKPLHHFRPGSLTFSVASAGCNLICPFCQNHDLSQQLRTSGGKRLLGRQWEAAGVVEGALDNGCESISFTYSEPVLSLEFAAEVARVARPKGVDLVFVTNGQINPGPAKDLAGIVSAANVDLKSPSAATYRDVLGGKLESTLETIGILKAAGVWVEVTTLVIPGFNDERKQLMEMAGFVARMDPSIPWHVSRFHPSFRWDTTPVTPESTLAMAFDVGAECGLEHVYTGNVHGHEGEKTRCAACSALIVDRVGYRIGEIFTDGGRCRSCGEPIAGVGFP